MVYKTPKGFTLIELLLAFTIIAIIAGVVFITASPEFYLNLGKDNKRLSDVSKLETIINEYRIDNGEFPGTANVTYFSDTLPAGQIGPLEDTVTGWILADLETYSSTLPVDPENSTTYRYIYRHNGTQYEINAVLEFNTDKMLNTSDGGNSDNAYEIGTNLTIL